MPKLNLCKQYEWEIVKLLDKIKTDKNETKDRTDYENLKYIESVLKSLKIINLKWMRDYNASTGSDTWKVRPLKSWERNTRNQFTKK